MTTFWMFMPWQPYHVSLSKLSAHCAFLNQEEMFLAPRAIGQFVQLPTAQLKLALEDFDLDCFHWSRFTLVSEKMREAMALGPTEIQYFDVDASESAPLPRSKNYRIMHVPVMEDVTDPKNSVYRAHHHPDGSVSAGAPDRVVFLADVQLKHELFHDRLFRVIYCTDDLALRVLRADCSGARFFDPTQWKGPSMRFRTLRGVEQEEKWDPFRKKLRTSLVREIRAR